MLICLWNWPASDEAAWQALCDQTMNFSEYQSLLVATQDTLQRMGYKVRIVKMTVAEMDAALARHAQRNTPEGRAAVVALWPR